MDCGIAHGSYLVVSALIKIKRLHFLVGGTLHHQLQDLVVGVVGDFQAENLLFKNTQLRLGHERVKWVRGRGDCQC